MKLKNLTLLAAFFASANIGFAQQSDTHTPQSDAFKLYERQSSLEEIAQAQGKLAQEPAWRQFKQSTGAAWSAEFDNLSKMPVRMYGAGIAVTGFDGTNHEAVSRTFLATHLNGFVPNGNVFQLKGVAKTKKYDVVSFTQYFNNMEVIQSNFGLRITPNGLIPMATLRYYAIDNSFNTTPNLSPAAIELSARQNIAGTITNVEMLDLKILPVALNDKYEPHLVQEVHVSGKERSGTPFEYVNLVDANTGTVWSRQNKVCSMHIPQGKEVEKQNAQKEAAPAHTAQKIIPAIETPTQTPNFAPQNTQGVLNIKSQVVSNFLQPATMKSLPFLGLTLSGTTPVYADINGNFNLNITTPVTTTVKLQGLNAKVTKVSTTAFSQATGVVINPTDTELDLTSRFTNTEIAGYYHTTVMREHFRTVTNNSNRISNVPMTVTVDIADSCNANYNGQLNFFANSFGCPASSLFDDVIYHEFGHHINAYFAGPAASTMTDGALNEGYADVWAMTKTDNPLLGAGFQRLPTSFVRRYDAAPKVYPLDVVGEVHGDGEMIAGSWWDVRVNLNSLADMTQLFIDTNAGYSEGSNLGDTFRGILLEALMQDDNDANIQNGTPHLNQIIQAFARHGITLITGSSLIHDQPVTPPTPYVAFPLDADFLIVDNAMLPYFGQLRTTYKINNGTWQSTPMTDVSSAGQPQTSFQTMIPGLAPGSIFSYYIDATDSYGTLFTAIPYEVNTANPRQSNLPNFLLSGYTLRMTDNFDGSRFTGNWTVNPYGTDNATTGVWVLGTPVGSSPPTGAIYINPNIDHTAGATNTKCYMTGNGTAGAGVGVNDVDAGVTTLLSPTLNLSSYVNPAITYYRWFSNDRGGSANPGNDPLEVLISGDAGTTWQHVEMTYKDDNSWRQMAFHPTDYVSNLSQVRLKFIASDSTRANLSLSGGSLVEFALDDVQVWEQTTAVATDNLAEKTTPLHIFPNPAQDFALVGLGVHANEKATIEVFNALGQSVASQSIEGIAEYRLNTQNLATGTYLIRATGSNWHAEERIVVKR